MIRAIHFHKAAIYLSVAGALALAPFAARAQSPIDAFVAKVTDGITGIHTQAGDDAAKTLAGCGDFLGTVLNLPAMAKTAARDALPPSVGASSPSTRVTPSRSPACATWRAATSS
jgi:hypothetical protein